MEKDEGGSQEVTGKYNPKGIEQTQQNITQETYLFVKEKDVLIKDVNNLCAFFGKLLDPEFKPETDEKKKFPFLMVKDRICHILEKYQEQPALLDVVIAPMVAAIMDSV